MDPKSLYTLQGALDFFEKRLSNGQTSTFYQSATFNFHDITGLVPASAYVNQPRCFALGCLTILPDYAPVLALPPAMRSMDPAWNNCALNWHGAWDPPIPLSPAAVEAKPTVPSAHTTSSTALPQGSASTVVAQTRTAASTSAASADPSTASNAEPSTSPPDTGGIYTDPSNASQRTRAVSHTLQYTTTIILVPQSTATRDSDDPTLTIQAWGSTASPISSSTRAQGSKDPAVSTSNPTEPDAGSGAVIIAGQTASAVGTGIVVADTTLRAGGAAITVSNIVLSALSNGALQIISEVVESRFTQTSADATTTVRSTSAIPREAVLTINSRIITASAIGTEGNAFVVAGTTLNVGGPAWTTSGFTLTAGSDGLLEIVSPSAKSIHTSSTPAAYTQAVLPLGTTTVTVASGTVAGMWIVNGKTLRLGDPGLTIAGHTLVPGANALYKDGVSASFQTVVGTKPWTTSTSYAPLPVLTTELAPLQGSGMVYVTTSADRGEAAPASTAIRSLASGCSGCATVTALLGFGVSVAIALILWW
ncbi:hypothetical protein Tdes44962_MAKER03814 [Teratosphaeria destructans]|uniref:Uncharacterized protein n=1 Tax=Teratosphaeria destructans TaxID=418781 RepID=A0A9W7SP79_9PEZI|nr:hypothetical protein Tdes44962_MAKER03814 [Teratosphaeria destructans]